MPVVCSSALPGAATSIPGVSHSSIPRCFSIHPGLLSFIPPCYCSLHLRDLPSITPSAVPFISGVCPPSIPSPFLPLHAPTPILVPSILGSAPPHPLPQCYGVRVQWTGKGGCRCEGRAGLGWLEQGSTHGRGLEGGIKVEEGWLKAGVSLPVPPNPVSYQDTLLRATPRGPVCCPHPNPTEMSFPGILGDLLAVSVGG